MTRAPATAKPIFASDGGFVDTPTFARAQLLAGNRIAGPALIEEHASTTVVLPGGCSVEVDAIGTLSSAFREQSFMSDCKMVADPVLVEIVRNGVMAVTEEMKINLMHAARLSTAVSGILDRPVKRTMTAEWLFGNRISRRLSD